MVFITAYGSELSEVDELWRFQVVEWKESCHWEQQELTEPQRVLSLAEKDGIRGVKLSTS